MSTHNTVMHASLLSTYAATWAGWLHDPSHALVLLPSIYYAVSLWETKTVQEWVSKLKNWL